MSTTEQSTNAHIGPSDTAGKDPAIDEAVTKLDRAISELFNDDGLRNYLTYKGAMHNYSWLNMLLIYMDYVDRGLDGPICTMGYKAWKGQGRNVKAGSKAIALFKPILQYWRDHSATPGSKGAKLDTKTGKWYYLRSRAVGFDIIRKTFHIQDTDGPEYNAPEPVNLEGDEELAEQIYNEVCNAATSLGVAYVRQEEMPADYGGIYQPSDKTIHINSNNSLAQQSKTVVHELAHHVSHVLELDHHEFYQGTRGEAEAVVEGAAFIVLSSYGLDSASYSVPYIAHWASDLNAIRRLLRDMDKVAKVIIAKLPHGVKND